MKITAILMRLSDGFPVVAVGFMEGITPVPVVLIAVNTTPMSALQGIFAQAKTIADVVAPRYAPLTTLSVN